MRIALNYIKKKKKGGETPVTTHTTPLQNKSTNAPVETKRRPKTRRPPDYRATGGGGGWEAKKDSPRVPAIAESRFSSRAKPKTPPKLGVAPSKTHPFRWFHQAQAPKITRELNPFLVNPTVALLEFSHHTSKDKSEGCGQNCWIPKCWSK